MEDSGSTASYDGGWICTMCGVWVPFGQTHTCNQYDNEGIKGWVCPLCGRSVAPWKAHCGCIPTDICRMHYTDTKKD